MPESSKFPIIWSVRDVGVDFLGILKVKRSRHATVFTFTFTFTFNFIYPKELWLGSPGQKDVDTW